MLDCNFGFFMSQYRYNPLRVPAKTGGPHAIISSATTILFLVRQVYHLKIKLSSLGKFVFEESAKLLGPKYVL